MITESQIRQICTKDALYVKGKELVRHQRVGQLQVKHERGNYRIKGYVTGDRGERYYNQVEIEDNRLYCECECATFHMYRGACEHNVAMLFKFIEDMANGEIKVEDMDEIYAKEMLDFYEEALVKSLETTRKGYIKVEPKLCAVNNSQYGIGLSVGEDRLYVVKNISKFVEDILQQNQVAYGKKFAFIHHEEAFEEQARPLIRLVIEEVLAKQMTIGNLMGARLYSTGDKKILPLSTSGFDKLFELYKGQALNCQIENEKQPMYLVEGNPQLQFNMDHVGEQFLMSVNKRQYELIQYPFNQYMVLEDKIYKCTEAFSSKIMPLLKYMQAFYPPQLKFNETAWKRFAMTVLPKIKKEVSIQGNRDWIEEYTPPSLSIKVYLDRAVDQSIVGEVAFDYKGYVFNPYDQRGEDEVPIARDVVQEHVFNQLIENYEFRAQKGKIHLNDDSQIYRFLKEGIDALMDIAEVHVTDQLKRMRITTQAPVSSVGLKVNSHLLHVDLGEIHLSVQEIEEILTAHRNKSKYYRLKQGEFVDLEGEGMDTFAAVVDGLGLSAQDVVEGKADVPLYKGLYLDQILRNSHEINAIRDKYFKRMIKDVRNVEDTEFEVPDALSGILRSYQQFGFRWLKTMASYGFGGVLADDMGLGKTLQVIAVLLSEKLENKEGQVSLVVAPTSLVLNWEREIQKFAPQLAIGIISGTGAVRKSLIEKARDKDVMITSYDSLKRDLEAYKDMTFRFCIADEAHYIKNPSTQNAKALKQIVSETRFALTGTPVENALAELWSIFDFIMPNYLFTYQHFKRKFETPIMRAENSHAMRYLQKLIAPFVLRRIKKDVLKELPEKTETIIYNQMEGEQEKLYQANLAQVQEDLKKELADKGLGRSHIKILAMLTRLRQICCHPGLYLDDYKGESSKLNQCMELIEEAVEGGHKVLLFSQFTTMLDKIGHELAKRKINYYQLTGATKAEQRMEMVENFNQDETPLFLISLKAGGTGLNLTGADIVIHYDPWWNVSSENQATDRAYRMGQEKRVQVFKLITHHSIEEKIKTLQDKKIGLADEILGGGEKLISKMTEDELKELFVVN